MFSNIRVYVWTRPKFRLLVTICFPSSVLKRCCLECFNGVGSQVEEDGMEDCVKGNGEVEDNTYNDVSGIGSDE